MISRIKTVMELAKIKITIAVSLTTITGYVLFKQGFSSKIILPTLGIFFLACGSSAINHIQESKTDRKMERTKNRPLPAGKISIMNAWIIALIFIVSGSFLLYMKSTLSGLILGLTALFWYNIIYTNLKKISYYAVIPGSIIGAIPPLVGWVTAGGPLYNTRTLALAFFFFVWQVPHFWLLMLKYGEQYKKAGFPTITIKSPEIIRVMTFVWTIATAISAIFLSYFKVVTSKYTSYGIIIVSGWLIIQFFNLLRKKENFFKPGKYFMRMNYYVLIMIVFLLTDHLFSHN